MSTPTAPEPEIVPGTSRPIPVDPDVVPSPETSPETSPEPDPEPGPL